VTPNTRTPVQLGDPARQTLSGTDADSIGLPTPRRYWSVAAIWLAMSMAVLDSAIANVALPTIAREYAADPTSAVSVINAYQVAIIMLLLPLASLGEILGYRRVYLGGLGIFVVASLGCFFAPSLAGLTAWRFVQGLGAAAIMAINGALVRHTYPASKLGKGIGLNAIVVAVSSAAGPAIAAAILAVASWRWLFAINIPIGIAAVAIGIRSLPFNNVSQRAFDWRSALLNALTFAAIFSAVEDVIDRRVGLFTVVAAAVAATAGTILVRVALKAADPLIPFDLLRLRVLRSSYATSVCAFAGNMIALTALPFYLQHRFEYSTAVTGLLITAFPLAICISAPLSGSLADRFSARWLAVFGLGLFGVGSGVFAFGDVGAKFGVAACLAACGFGFGLFQAPNNRIMLSNTPVRRSGAGAGMLAMSRLGGQISGALVVALTFRLVGTTAVTPFVVAAGFGIAGALIVMTRSDA
jgi:DHA2 family multidrug resistance protein-like MFS transporter